MTKKFWNNWQNRIGETKNIYLVESVTTKNGKTYWFDLRLGSTRLFDKIISANFHNDTVDLVIKRVDTWNHHSENEYITLHRNEIKSVKF